MSDDFRILFVDDEETFLYSTTDLLRREGFTCDCVPEVSQAIQLLDAQHYDLVIADIKMPGNDELEFVRQLSTTGGGLAVILVTGHPTMASAIQSIELPVVAYLVKPFNLDELLNRVRSVMTHARMKRALVTELARLQEYRAGLLNIEAAGAAARGGVSAPSLQAFVGLTLRNIVDGLSTLQALAEPGGADSLTPRSSSLGPQLSREMRSVLREAVATLERTKTAFKSKDLGELRKKLDSLLNA